MIAQKHKHPGEKVLFQTRPKFISTMQSALVRIIVLLLLLYFFTTIIAVAALIQNHYSVLVGVPFVEYSTYFLILILALLFLSIIWTVLGWRATNYMLTTQRVMIKSGVLRKKTVYMHYNKMQDINLSQGLIQRISNSGDIAVYGGRDITSLILENIPKPEEVEEMINDNIERSEENYKARQKYERY